MDAGGQNKITADKPVVPHFAKKSQVCVTKGGEIGEELFKVSSKKAKWK